MIHPDKKGSYRLTEERKIKLNEYLKDFFNQPTNDEIWNKNLQECV